jgi:hypothetical protein
MTTMVSESDSDTKAIKDGNLQAMIVKNQKLESKLAQFEPIKKEVSELKTQRDK